MKRLMCSLLLSVAAAASPPAGLVWRASVPEASVEARQSDKMLFLDFRADWCTPCKFMEAEVYTPSTMARIATRALPVQIDVQKQEVQARRYAVSTLPTIVVTDSWGGEIFRHTGTLDTATIRAMLEALPPDSADLNRQEALLALNRDDAQALTEMGRLLREKQLFLASRSYYLRALQHSSSAAEEVLNGLAEDCVELRQRSEATKWLTRCLKQFPDSVHREEWRAALERLRTLPAT